MTQQEKFGTDEWVQQFQQRRSTPQGLRGIAQQASTRLPVWGWLALLAIGGLLLPQLTDNSYYIRVAGSILLWASLALGLNLVVGYTGLLDLGFIAFYGIGAYAYAYLSSPFTGLHWDTGVTLVVVTLVAALFGLLLGSPSLRLIGDYLAIVTLGFGQIFVQLTTSLTRVNLPGLERPVNLTGGPNGIIGLDPLRFFSFTAESEFDYYYVLLFFLILILVVVYHLRNSRLGRALRALREDELAAETMGMPTRWLKLQAFAIGAAIAGASGALFAARQGNVFPGNFDLEELIILYAIVVLGGLGSLPGVLIGAAIMLAVPEVLRDVNTAGALFYAGVLITLYVTFKPRWQIAPFLATLFIFAVLFTGLLVSSWPGTTALLSPSNAGLGLWLAIPPQATHVGNLAFGLLIILVLTASRLKNHLWRFIILLPTLYVLAFVWETRLSQEPSVTRLLFVGLLLIVLMIYRPNGLLGQKRVEVV